jgi:membrane-associated phospholipid phosphatase
MFTLPLLVLPSQYLALALHRPLIDPWLSAIDAAMGINVHAWAEWTRAHRGLARVLLLAYKSLVPQLFLPILVLGFWYRDRLALWEYTWLFHVCSAITVVIFAIWPAASPFLYRHYVPVFNQFRFMEQFRGIYSGASTVVHWDAADGLVAFPSFHVAGAMIVTWALRRYAVWRAVLIPLNVTLAASTLLSGMHYATDLLGSLALCAFAVWSWRVWACGLLRTQRVENPTIHPEPSFQHAGIDHPR